MQDGYMERACDYLGRGARKFYEKHQSQTCQTLRGYDINYPQFKNCERACAYFGPGVRKFYEKHQSQTFQIHIEGMILSTV